MTMTLGDISLACAWALIDELARGGVRHACLSPGSRSTALALALARHPSIELQVHLDERSGAFVALGIARATVRPVIAACTSGTAAAEFFPAVVEASRSRVPLVMLTADRPPWLRGTGANQTINQVDLYGSYAEYLEPPVPTSAADENAWRSGGRDAVLGMRRTWQPVHLNCPFDEPLTPSPGVTLEATPIDAVPWGPPEPSPLSAEDEERLARELSDARGVVVIGDTWPHRPDPDDLVPFEQLGWPVVAEPISNLRRQGALTAGQALVGNEDWVAAHRPDVVLQLGATPTTRATQSFVAAAERLIVADRIHPDPDPEHHATWRLRSDMPDVMGALLGRDVTQRSSGGSVGIAVTSSLDRPTSPSEIAELMARALELAPPGWAETWREADERARRAMDELMDSWEEPSASRIARDVAASVPTGGILFVGNSSPIRDLDMTMAPRDDIEVIANRGASGIDGLASTAIGIASASRRPTVALLGDLSAIHDVGALAWNARRIDIDLTIVVVDNVGGQIFSALAQRELPEHRKLFVTPHELNLNEVTSAFGISSTRVEDASELVPALATRSRDGIRLVRIVVAPRADRAFREELRTAVEATLS